MDKTGLPARIGYAVVAFPVVGAAAFYTSTWLWPKIAGADLGIEGYGIFAGSLGVGAVFGLTAFLLALTLPWTRRRRRGGRTRRVVVACVVVVLASLGFAGLGHQLIYDLLFAAWLAYAMAFTYVRYGVRDRARRTASDIGGDSSVDYVG
jgi:hypothetical protein